MPAVHAAQTIEARRQRRNNAILAGVWAGKITHVLNIQDASRISRATSYVMRKARKNSEKPAWYPTSAIADEIIQTAKAFVLLTNSADRTKALTPSAALRDMVSHADAYGARAVYALESILHNRGYKIEAQSVPV